MSVPSEGDPACTRRLETGDAAKRRGLTATARAEQRDELMIRDGEVESLDRHHLAELLG